MLQLHLAVEPHLAPKVADIYDKPVFNVKEMPGITDPLGFFDPAGFTEGASEGKVRFYREVELKHGRVAMLAAVGFLVGEQFHPLFGGDIDAPGIMAFQQTPLETFWGQVLLVISSLEVFSVFSFNSPAGGEPWSIRSDHKAGDFGFDPLGLKPTDPEELKEMQNKELNHCRLAMIGASGMIAQELVSGTKLFELKGGSREPLNVLDMPGITAPVGFFDPLGFSKDCSEGRLRFYREVELKHGRVAMLAALGFLVGENF